jgi:CelD/BcsL family acetyltransferase involved in cellulose biosynthesis
MQIDRIQNLARFNELESNWDAVYAADQHATFFLSWPWMRGFLQTLPNNWFILAARPNKGARYVAFLPLRLHFSRQERLSTLRELHLAGDILADYTGFLCSHGCEQEALASFAAYVKKQLDWDRFIMRDVMDPRVDQFLYFFPDTGYELSYPPGTPAPLLKLPTTWEQYRYDALGAESRRNLNRSIRSAEQLEGLSVLIANRDNLDSQIEALLSLWQQRWGIKPDTYLARIRSVFRSCSERESLRLVVLSHLGAPVAALAAFLDCNKKVVLPFICSFAENFRQIKSPGRLLLANNINFAIENGFLSYDFLRGNGEYKFLFGAHERFTRNVEMTRRTLAPSIRWKRISLRIWTYVGKKTKGGMNFFTAA